MNRRVLSAVAGCLMACATVWGAEPSIAGKWATDAVATATRQTTSGGGTKSIINDAIGRGARNPSGGGGRGSTGRVGGAGRGGNNFAQIGGPGRGGGRGNQRGGGVNRGGSPDGVALTMDLKVDKKGKITGKITDVVHDTKADIDSGQVTGATFEFKSSEKKGGAKISTVYKGELKAADTIVLTRTLTDDKPIDKSPDDPNKPLDLVFHRAK